MKLALLALFAAALAPAAELTGKWELILDTPGGERRQKVELTMDGDAIVMKGANGTIKGTLTDGAFKFSFPSRNPQAPGTATFAGKLVDNELKGTWEVAEYKGDFKGVRDGEPAAPADIPAALLGTWDIQIEAEGASHDGKLTLKSQEGKLTGIIRAADRELEIMSPVASGDSLKFSVRAGQREVAFDLKVANDTLTGGLTTGNGSGSVKGKKSAQ